MIAAELRGGSKPSLEEALGWIGSRVDDIYGANVGRLEDVWIDPGSGLPRWLLVKGRFSGRTTLIPFDHATAGAGHVWVPYEREVVRDAPEIQAGARPTATVEAALRNHYAQRAPGEAVVDGDAPAHREPHNFQQRPVARPRRQVLREQPRPQPSEPSRDIPRYRPLPRPTHMAPVEQRLAHPAHAAQPQQPAPVPPPVTPPAQSNYGDPVEGGWTVREPAAADRASWQPPPRAVPAHAVADPVEDGGWAVGAAPPAEQHHEPAPAPLAAAPQPQQQPAEALQALLSASVADANEIEIQLTGEITIRGALGKVRVVPREEGPAGA